MNLLSLVQGTREEAYELITAFERVILDQLEGDHPYHKLVSDWLNAYEQEGMTIKTPRRMQMPHAKDLWMVVALIAIIFAMQQVDIYIGGCIK